MMGKLTFTSVDQYHQAFPETRHMLDRLREIIRDAAPDATETISYNMPAFRQRGVLVYYAAYNTHIGFYPTASPMKHFAARMKAYKTSKGAIQFPVARPLPEALIADIVAFRLEEDRNRHQAEYRKNQKEG